MRRLRSRNRSRTARAAESALANKATAIELVPNGVRVVAIGPTAIGTPMTHARLHGPVIGTDLLARIPMGRFGEVVDCAGAVVFLASPAASLITGTTIMVDGGWTAQ